MITVEELIRQVLSIESEAPVYRTGGTGKDGICDCIGAVMGAMYRLGRLAYPLHSSNYFARYQTDHLHEVTCAEELTAGEVVYKAAEDPSGLHERYLPGGTHANGDTRDYYHAGMVVSTQPLIIVHCTSSDGVNGFTRDTAIGRWQWAGRVKGVAYKEKETVKATVTVPSGTTANLRLRPSVQSRRIDKIPAGTAVSVVERTDEWSRIITPEGETGYMMTQFLQFNQNDTLETRLAALEDRVSRLERGA